MRERQKKKHDDSTTTDQSPSPSPPSRSPSPDESEDLQRLENAPPFWRSESSKRLSKQLSMFDLPGDAAWERRRRKSQRRKSGVNKEAEKITDEDLHELKGCIDLGFGFNEENGQRLCTTLPALDLYFAVNRQFVTSPISSPAAASAASPPPSLPPAAGRRGRSASFGSDAEAWRICSQGDDPRHVKTKLRHWALAVACSVKQSS